MIVVWYIQSKMMGSESKLHKKINLTPCFLSVSICVYPCFWFSFYRSCLLSKVCYFNTNLSFPFKPIRVVRQSEFDSHSCPKKKNEWEIRPHGFWSHSLRDHMSTKIKWKFCHFNDVCIRIWRLRKDLDK